jgi:hypothetical protein
VWASTLTSNYASVTGTLVSSAASITGTLVSSAASITGAAWAASITLNYASVTGTLVSGAASITGAAWASSLTTNYASVTGTVISGAASITGNLFVGGSIIGTLASGAASVAGTLVAGAASVTGTLVAGAASITGNLYVGGSIIGALGTIGDPTGLTNYGSLNIAGLLPADLVPDAFYKIEQILDSMFTLPSTPNSSGQTLQLLSQKTLALNVPAVYSACIQASATLVTDLVSVTRPQTALLTNFYDGAKGTLTAVANGTAAGSLDMSQVALGSAGSVSGFLNVTAKGDFYAGNALLSGKWYYTNAYILPTLDFARGPVQNSYQMMDSRSGITNTVTFHIDDSVVPAVQGGSVTLSLGTQTQFISGVNGCAPSMSVSVAATVTGAIQSYYNSTYGLAQLTGSNISSSLEKNRSGRNVLVYTPGSPQFVGLTSTFNSSSYNESSTFSYTVYNAISNSVTYTASTYGGKSVRIDSVSTVRSNQCSSGTTQFPQVAGTDFGIAYNNTISLLTNMELQQLNGYFRVPASFNYANVFPASFDYTNVNAGVAYRYACFRFQITTPIANALISFTGQVGSTSNWGSGSTLASGMTLQIRIINAALATDSGWMDANSFWNGGTPSSNGAPCLLVSNTTNSVKSVTFGIFRLGLVYVRIGFAIAAASGMGFQSIAVSGASPF